MFWTELSDKYYTSEYLSKVSMDAHRLTAPQEAECRQVGQGQARALGWSCAVNWQHKLW